MAAEFDTIDLFPQDHVSADVSRECSQSRDAELRVVDWFGGGESIQGRVYGAPQVSLSSFPSCRQMMISHVAASSTLLPSESYSVFSRSPTTSLPQTKATPSTYSDPGSRHVAHHLRERIKSSHSLAFALPQQVCTTPLRQSPLVLAGSSYLYPCSVSRNRWR